MHAGCMHSNSSSWKLRARRLLQAREMQAKLPFVVRYRIVGVLSWWVRCTDVFQCLCRMKFSSSSSSWRLLPSGSKADASGRGDAKPGAKSAGIQTHCESSTSCFVCGVTKYCMHAGCKFSSSSSCRLRTGRLPWRLHQVWVVPDLAQTQQANPRSLALPRCAQCHFALYQILVLCEDDSSYFTCYVLCILKGSCEAWSQRRGFGASGSLR